MQNFIRQKKMMPDPSGEIKKKCFKVSIEKKKKKN